MADPDRVLLLLQPQLHGAKYSAAVIGPGPPAWCHRRGPHEDTGPASCVTTKSLPFSLKSARYRIKPHHSWKGGVGGVTSSGAQFEVGGQRVC